MNKLQLHIAKSFNGYKVLLNINPSEDYSTHVHELRKIVERISYDPTEKNIFYLLRNTESGVYIVIIRTIPSMQGDHLAAWIYVPNEVVIDGESLEKVVQSTTRKVSGDRVTQDDVNDLRELFATEYPTEAEAPALIPSDPRGELAWRIYNGESGLTLSDLLGKGIKQLAYAEYSGVLFIDGDLGVTVEAANISDSPLGEPARILPPGRSQQGFSPYIYGRALDQVFLGTIGFNLPVVWRRPAFEDVESAQIIDSAEFTPTEPDTEHSLKSISRNSFRITGQHTNEPLNDCHITVNGFDISEEPHLFTQAELASASVVVNCPGFFPYAAHIDLATTTRALVKMAEKRKVYSFEMPVKSSDLGAPVRFNIYSKKPLTDSPIEGYELLGDLQEGESRTNHLGFSRPSMPMVTKAIYAGAGLVAGLILGLCFSTCGSGHEEEIDAIVVEAPADETPMQDGKIVDATQPIGPAKPAALEQKADDNAADSKVEKPAADNNAALTAEALEYLDNNKSWDKEKLESFACLKGLYDDMNNFRLDRLTGEGVWARKLSKSKAFARIDDHAGKGLHKKVKFANPTYNTDPNDMRINIQGYLNRIDP